MKNIIRWYGFVLFVLLAQLATAQQARLTKGATQFSAFPAVVSCTEAQLSNLFEAPAGQTVKLILPGKLILEGQVKSKVNKFGKIQTIAVQLPNFNNSVMAITKKLEENNEISYTAHLFNNHFTDGYELKRTGKNSYQFEKIEMNKVLPLCNQ